MCGLSLQELRDIKPLAVSFLEHAREDINEIGNRFFMLGCRLYEARYCNYVEALGYESIEQLAEFEFGFKRSTTYNLIAIFNRFCYRDEHGYKAWIDPKYRDYSYSQLIEMQKATCLKYNITKQIPSKTSVRVISEYIKYVNKNPGDSLDLPDWFARKEEITRDGLSSTLESVATLNNSASEEIVSEEVNVPVQTFGRDLQDILNEDELTDLLNNCCKIFAVKFHIQRDDGLWLKVVPSAFSEMFYPCLKEFIENKLRKE